MKTFIASAIVALSLVVSGCGNVAFQAPSGASHIKQFDGGVVVGEWDASDVACNRAAEYCVFTDAKTGRFMTVTGTLQVTEAPPSR